MHLYRRLLLAATLLALLVIGLGAYVRLSDAGLGCPDWPGCYGHWLGVPDSRHEQLAANAAFPQQPVDTGKAWKEMLHRYCAGTLGLLILAISAQAWRREVRRQYSPVLPMLLFGIVGLQAALGMWTVSLLLKPLIVTLHLLGGMTTLALLFVLYLRSLLPVAPAPPGRAIRWSAAVALLSVFVQIALGGWVSSNYAGLACPDLLQCGPESPSMLPLAAGFALQHDFSNASEWLPRSGEALAAIQWMHRLGAAGVLVAASVLAGLLLTSGKPAGQRLGGLLLGVLGIQLSLGLGNVLFSLPLALAVSHTLGAACLLTVVLVIHARYSPGRSLQTADQPRHDRPLVHPNQTISTPSSSADMVDA